MHWSLWIILIVLALLVVGYLRARRRARDPNRYMQRASALMDKVERSMARVEEELQSGSPSRAKLAMEAANLRMMADLQRSEIVPTPAMERHKETYYRIIDLQYRKVDDLLMTGGANLDALAEEEAELARESEAFSRQQHDQLKQMVDSMGIPMPDFTEPPRR